MRQTKLLPPWEREAGSLRPAGPDLERTFPSTGLPAGSPRKDARTAQTPTGDEGRVVRPVVRVLLVEDHAVFRELFASAFDREPDFEVVAQADTLAGAREALEGVDVAVLDLQLPDGEGTDLIGELRERSPHAAARPLTSFRRARMAVAQQSPPTSAASPVRKARPATAARLR